VEIRQNSHIQAAATPAVLWNKGNMSGIDSNNVTMNHLEKTSEPLVVRNMPQVFCFIHHISKQERRIEALCERKQIFIVFIRIL
jgi:hypothetical protein